MSRTIESARQEALTTLLSKERKAAGLTQAALAKKLGRYQSYIANVESGQRRIDVIEFLDLAKAIGFEPGRAVRSLTAIEN